MDLPVALVRNQVNGHPVRCLPASSPGECAWLLLSGAVSEKLGPRHKYNGEGGGM